MIMLICVCAQMHSTSHLCIDQPGFFSSAWSAKSHNDLIQAEPGREKKNKKKTDEKKNTSSSSSSIVL